jgi:hypothetical protein
MIKKSDSSINVVFKDGAYTNKLYARNIQLNISSANTLNIDYSHYSKQKRSNLEDSDFEKLIKGKANISHFFIADKTVQKAIENTNITQVTLKLSETESVTIPVTDYDKPSGLLK